MPSTEFYRAMLSAVDKTGSWYWDAWNRRKSGEGFLARQDIRAILDEFGVATRYVVTFFELIGIDT